MKISPKVRKWREKSFLLEGKNFPFTATPFAGPSLFCCCMSIYDISPLRSLGDLYPLESACLAFRALPSYCNVWPYLRGGVSNIFTGEDGEIFGKSVTLFGERRPKSQTEVFADSVREAMKDTRTRGTPDMDSFQSHISGARNT